MPIDQEYEFGAISPGATVNLYIYGYPQNLIGVHDAIPYEVYGGTAFTPLYAIKLSGGGPD